MASFGFPQNDLLASEYISKFDGPDTLIIIDTDPVKHYRYALDMNNPFALSNVRIGPLVFDGSHGLPLGDFSVLAEPDFLEVKDSLHTITSFHYVGYGDYLYRDLGITAKKITSSGVKMVFYGSGKGYRPLDLSGLEEGLYLQTYLVSISKNYSKGEISAMAINYIEKPGYVVAYNLLDIFRLNDDLYFMKALKSHMWGFNWRHRFNERITLHFRNSYHYTSKDKYIRELGGVNKLNPSERFPLDPDDGYNLYQSQWIESGVEYAFNDDFKFYFKSFSDIYNYQLDQGIDFPDYDYIGSIYIGLETGIPNPIGDEELDSGLDNNWVSEGNRNFSVKKKQIGFKRRFGRFGINASIDYIENRDNLWSGTGMYLRGGYEIRYQSKYSNNLEVNAAISRKNSAVLAYRDGEYFTSGNIGDMFNSNANISVIRHYTDNIGLYILKKSAMLKLDLGRIEWEDRKDGPIHYFDIPFYSLYLEYKNKSFRTKIFYKKFKSPEYRGNSVADESGFSSFMPLVDTYYSYNIYYSFKFKEKYRFRNFVELNGRYSHFTGDAFINRYSDSVIDYECSDGCFNRYTHVINLGAGFDFGDFVLRFCFITNNGGEFAAFNSNEEVFPVPVRNFLGENLNIFHYIRIDWKFKD